MKRLITPLFALALLVAPIQVRAEGVPEGSLAGMTFEQGMCAICQGAGYSPACFICTLMMMLDAVGGWD